MTRQADLIRVKRQRLALPGGAHDRLVRWLAVLLPATIGATLAVMVLAPLFPRGEISFILDRNKVATTQHRLSVDRAIYRGEDAKGRAFSLTAGSVVQRSARVPQVQLSDLSARILLADGPAELSAKNGLYDLNANTVQVPGRLEFQAADGYRLTTDNVAFDLRGHRIIGTGGVAGAVPSGTFRADQFTADLERRSIVLMGRARLQMQPQR